MSRAIAVFAVLLLVAPGCTHRGAVVVAQTNAQQVRASPPPHNRDHADPEFLTRWAETGRFNLGTPQAVHVTPDGSQVLFLRSQPRSPVRDLYSFDVATATERVLLTADAVLHGDAEQLSAEERARRDRMRQTGRGIASFAMSTDGSRLLVPLSGRLFVVERASGAVREVTSRIPGPAVAPQLSPDGRRVAAVRAGEVYVTDIATGQEHPVTRGAHGTVTHGIAEFVAQEEMDRMDGFWWSPDAATIAFEEADSVGVERLHVFNPAQPDQEPETNTYPRAGTANVSVRVGLVPVAGGTPTWVEWDHVRWPYLATVRWMPNAPLTLVVEDRAQSESVVLAADEHGHTRVLWTERDAAWVEIDATVPAWLPDGSGFLWNSDRNGNSQLELHGRDGSLVRAVTPRDVECQNVVHVDQDTRSVVFRGGDDPTAIQLFRVGLDGGAADRLGSATGEHDAVFAEHGGLRVHEATRLDGPATWTVERADGSVAGTLRSVAEEPGFTPRVQMATVGVRGLRALVIRPRDFDPSVHYPVIDEVYGGPSARMVRTVRNRYLLSQWIADHGYIVVSIDGRGTPGRGHDWRRAVRGRLGDVPLEDQVDGLRALGARFAEMDTTRVGIYGWSFGGYLSALAVLSRPDTFRAAVAGAPVTDWREYDTFYTERFLGLPSEHHDDYDRASLVVRAGQLSRPLLVVHGTADDNVYFANSLSLADALFRAGRNFEFLPLVGFTHLVQEPNVTRRLMERIVGFFDRAIGNQ